MTIGYNSDMCGRYSIFKLQEFIDAHFRNMQRELIQERIAQGRYNVSPGQNQLVIRRVDGKLVMDELKWGYDHPTLNKLVFNARSDKINTSMFKSSFHNRRCLVPARGFYDWDESGQPYWFRLKSQEMFCFAGLWDKDRFAFMTVEPNSIVAPYHDRMPVMLLTPDQWETWLDRPAKELLTPLDPALMEAYPVNKFGRRDSVENIEPLPNRLPNQPTLFG